MKSGSCCGANREAGRVAQGAGKTARSRRLLGRLLPRNDVGDAIYAWVHYLVAQGRLPGAKHSGRLNDYLFSMKVDGTLLDPLRQFVTDKVYAKHYIAAVAGEQYTMQTLQILHTVEQVNRLQLSQFPCVVKPSHLSGHAQFLLKDASTLNRPLMKDWLKQNYYHYSREQNHKYLSPKILVEEFFSENELAVPRDYKVFCYEGRPKFIQVDSGRFVNHSRNLYDTAWKRLPWSLMYPTREEDDPPPAQLEHMLEIAARLSAPFTFMRVDMFANSSEVKVGELTSCPGSARERISPPDGEYALGRLLLGGD